MKLKIKYPIIVEGKYDKIKLDSLVDAKIVTTGGFSIFNDEEKIGLIRRLADKSKIIILTDSDGAGHLIRSHIKTALLPNQIINLYTPYVFGKEKRKREPSREGALGVEGIDSKKLIELLEPFSVDAPEKDKEEITKADFYRYGLGGKDNSRRAREELLKRLDLPLNMSANAMLQAINILYTKEEFEELLK